MSPSEAGGIAGVLLMLLAYAAGQLGRLKMDRAPALLMNLTGSLMVLWSLSDRFNLPATLMEGAWALVALFGLIKLAARRWL